MKKVTSITFILIGLALLVVFIIFFINATVTGESLTSRDWIALISGLITTIVGLGSNLKAWRDLLQKDKPSLPTAQPTTQIIVQGGNTQLGMGDNIQNIQTEINSEKRIVQQNAGQSQLDKIKPLIKKFLIDSLREQEIREIISDQFPEVELNISSKSSVRELVGELSTYAIRQGQLEYLIEITGKYNPYQYNKYKHEFAAFISVYKD